MAWRRRKVVEPLRDGQFRLNLERDARALVVRLTGELRDVIMRADPSSDALRRLFPVAYHADPDADAEYQRLMREELVASRLSNFELIDTTLRPDDDVPPVLTAEQLNALMQSLNALRLVLGTMLDVGEDDDPLSAADVAAANDDVDESESLAGERYLYDYLSWLLEHVVQALTGTL